MGEEIQTLAAILASNKPEVSTYSLRPGREWAELAQEAEPAIEALYASLNPIETRMRAYAAQLGEVCIEFLDLMPVPDDLAPYADRKALAASVDDADDPADDSPKSDYRRAYKKSGDHNQAYLDVTKSAAGRSRWRKARDGRRIGALEEDDETT